MVKGTGTFNTFRDGNRNLSTLDPVKLSDTQITPSCLHRQLSLLLGIRDAIRDAILDALIHTNEGDFRHSF